MVSMVHVLDTVLDVAGIRVDVGEGAKRLDSGKGEEVLEGETTGLASHDAGDAGRDPLDRGGDGYALSLHDSLYARMTWVSISSSSSQSCLRCPSICSTSYNSTLEPGAWYVFLFCHDSCI